VLFDLASPPAEVTGLVRASTPWLKARRPDAVARGEFDELVLVHETTAICTR
jgi:hypothetical protein